MSKFIKNMFSRKKNNQTSKVPIDPTTNIIPCISGPKVIAIDNLISKVPSDPTTHIIPCPSGQKVIAIDDLLKEILLRLPAKSLFQFKSVSKHWHFIISDKGFLTYRNYNSSCFSGLFYHIRNNRPFYWSTYAQQSNLPLKFLPLKHDHAHFESITHIPNLSGIIILNSCHGLLLCLGYNEIQQKVGYQVLNPTTKLFHTINLSQNPEVNEKALLGVFLAYDPLLSPHYKIVAVFLSSLEIGLPVINTDMFETNYPDLFKTNLLIEIYSSETTSWSVCGTEYTIKGPSDVIYSGVYWNGAINWLNCWSSPVYFKVDEKRLGTMPALMVPQGKTWNEAETLYYGESSGHLYSAEIYDPTVQFNVYEMRKDYSEWFVKYTVDLSVVATDFPEMTFIIGRNRHCSYDVLSVVTGGDDEEEGSFMVLHISGKFIRYSLVHNNYDLIHAYAGDTLTRNGNYKLEAIPYIESFSSV